MFHRALCVLPARGSPLSGRSLCQNPNVIHTSNIIETAIHSWRQLIGNSIADVESFLLTELNELAEIAFTIQPLCKRLHVSWMQEDGKQDGHQFYWLSLRDESHFTTGSLVPIKVNSAPFATIAEAEITSVRLFGHCATDAVFASLLQTNNTAIAIATTRWMSKKQHFSKAGSEDLAVLKASELQSWVSNQKLELVADIY